jgi:type I restriction-modification system DNA methylase subunit
MADKKSFTKLISSTTDTFNNELEKNLWTAADGLRASSSLSAQEYSRPVLRLIFLKYADHSFSVVEKEIAKKAEGRNVNSIVFHQPSCKYYNCPNCTAIFKTRDEAVSQGYKPCRMCNP